jgi:hypothetical protein
MALKLSLEEQCQIAAIKGVVNTGCQDNGVIDSIGMPYANGKTGQ